MRDEISNAEVDRILQQLRQDQPAAAADDPVDSILKSLGVEPSAGQGKRRLHQMAQQNADTAVPAASAANEMSFHPASETEGHSAARAQSAPAVEPAPAARKKTESRPAPAVQPAPAARKNPEPKPAPAADPAPAPRQNPQPQSAPAASSAGVHEVVVDENFRRFFTQTLDNLEEPAAARSRRKKEEKKEKREKRSLLRRWQERQPEPAPEPEQEQETERRPEPQQPQQEQLPQAEERTQQEQPSPRQESRPAEEAPAVQPVSAQPEAPAAQPAPAEEDTAPTRPFEPAQVRIAPAPVREDTGEFSMALDPGAWSCDTEPEPESEPESQTLPVEEPTRLLNPEQEEQPEPEEEQDEPEEQEEPEKPRRGLLSRLRLLGSREEEDELEEESESPADEEPEEEPGEEHGEESWQELEDYTAPDQAQKVMADLSAMSLRFVLRAVLTGVLAAALLWMGVGATGLLLLPAVIDPVADPLPFLTVNLLLCAAAALISFSTIKEGLVGLFGRPSADTMPALAALGALAQALALLLAPSGYDPGLFTLFSGVAVLGLCTNAVGKLVHNQVVLRNFEMASSRVEHWAACMVTDKTRLSAVARGMDEPDPQLLVSRPTALVRNFLRHSFSSRASQLAARQLSYLLLGVAVLCAVVGGFMAKSAAVGVSVLAAALCLGAPFASTLLAAVPSLLMQKSAGKVGAVVPGWDAVEALGRTNMVLVGAKDIFPATSVVLKGIKTFEKERIDLAILYAASILIEGCDTLRDVFSHIIEGRTDILYPVESMTREVGYGYSAWINEERVLVGNRDMMMRHGLAVPSLDWEARCSKNGERQLLYLAVSGKLFGVFGICYKANPEVQEVLESLNRRGISLLVKSDDCSLTSQLIAQIYHLPEGCVKVLTEAERTALSPELIFRPESEGVMTHIGSFASFVGGLRAAEGAAAGEKLAAMVQKGAVVFSCLVALLLTFTGGIIGLALPAVLLYQAAWTVLQLAVPLGKAS